jgi:serine/threonine protein phosphatase PrpC
MVGDALIGALVGKISDPQAACQALVDLALESGGKDNVTVVLAHYSIEPAARS